VVLLELPGGQGSLVRAVRVSPGAELTRSVIPT
jgi:hypothetical protein